MNVQGRFDSGRGADGLDAVHIVYNTSRFGPGVKLSARPLRLSGKRHPAKPDPRARVFVPPRRRPSKHLQIRHRQQFITWLKRWHSQLYARAKKSADIAQAREGTLNGLGGWWESFTDSLTEVGGAVLQYKTQKDILDAQMERMRLGLPPLQTAEYAPTVRIDVGAETTRDITGAIGAGFGKMLPWLALGGGMLLLVTMGRKRR